MIVFSTIPIVNFTQALYEITRIGRMRIPVIYPYTLLGYKQEGVALNVIMPSDRCIPRQNLLEDTEPDFDYYYWKQLMEDQVSSTVINQILALEFDNGPNVIIYIGVTTSGYSMSITESLRNFLNVIYGLDAKLIMSTDDVYDESFPEYTPFSANGAARITAYIQQRSEAAIIGQYQSV